MNPSILEGISADRLKSDLFSFCRDPFSFRTVMYTIPWHTKNSLLELDDMPEEAEEDLDSDEGSDE